MLLIIAYAISALAIATYLRLAVTGDATWFNRVNACGWPIFVSSMIAHAYPAAILNLFFTLVGTVGVITHWRQKRALKTFNETVVELGWRDEEFGRRRALYESWRNPPATDGFGNTVSGTGRWN